MSTTSQNPTPPGHYTSQHYTPQNQHPEDRIYADKQYINRTQAHMQEVFQRLVRDLRLNKNGEEMLFDFVYNEQKACEFCDILAEARITYKALTDNSTEEKIKPH